jgi:hypothetical protein
MRALEAGLTADSAVGAAGRAGVLASYAQVLRHSVPLAGQPTRNPVADTAATGPGAP